MPWLYFHVAIVFEIYVDMHLLQEQLNTRLTNYMEKHNN